MSSTIKFEGTQKSKQWGMLSNEEINKVMDEYDQGQLQVSTTATTTTTTTTTSTTTRTTNPKGQVRTSGLFNPKSSKKKKILFIMCVQIKDISNLCT